MFQAVPANSMPKESGGNQTRFGLSAIRDALLTQKIHSVLYSSLPMECIRLEIIKQTISNDEVTVMHLGVMLSLETINQFLQLVRPEPALHLVLEMAAVTSLDSAGIGALMHLFVHRKSQRQKLSLAELAPQGKAVVEVGVY